MEGEIYLDELENIKISIRLMNKRYFDELSKIEGININEIIKSDINENSPYFKWQYLYQYSNSIIDIIDTLPLDKIKYSKERLVMAYPINVSRPLVNSFALAKIKYLEGFDCNKSSKLVLHK